MKENGKPDVMNLNIFEDHLSYVKNLFKRKNKLALHMKRCEKSKHLKFPGGYFTPSKTSFENLNEIGITVETQLQNYPWMLTWDMVGWLVVFGLNDPLRQYFSLYRVVSQREGERKEKG